MMHTMLEWKQNNKYMLFFFAQRHDSVHYGHDFVLRIQLRLESHFHFCI